MLHKSPRTLACLVLASLLVFGNPGKASAGSIIYVKWNAGGANTGASWADAYKNLQTALGAAVSGDQLWVAKGTYYATGSKDQTISFTLKSGVAMYGGFAGGETKLSQRKPITNLTILSGDIGAAGVMTDNSYHVVSASGVSASTILDGFKILGGNACGSTLSEGGGIYDSYASPTLRNLTLGANNAYYGGGIYNDHSSPLLTNVTFSGDQAFCGGGQGGGMYNVRSKPTLKNVTFSGNSAASGGGAIDNSLSNAILINGTFSGNTVSGGDGGAMFNDSSNPTLRNVTFSGNSASGGGDAIYNGLSNPTIYDSILWGDGTQEVKNDGSAPAIKNTIVKGGCPSGSSCTAVLSADPKLGPLQNNGGFTQTRALGLGSAAIDKGNISTCVTTDQRGVHRPQGPACDMGAFEVRVMSFRSVGSYDGWVLESTGTSGVGGSLDSSSTTFRVGDDASNRQYRGLLSFNTAALPNTGSIVRVVLQAKKSAIAGTNPFTTHGPLLVDIHNLYFGSALALENADFQSSPSLGAAGTFSPTLVSGWYRTSLLSSAFPYVSRLATTQLRLRFKLDDNNDSGADYIAFYSGNTATASDRPLLQVYYLP